MSVNEIIQELPKLSAEDRHRLRLELEEQYAKDYEETPEMLAAIDEGLRSLREEPTCTLDELREDMRSWIWIQSKCSRQTGHDPYLAAHRQK